MARVTRSVAAMMASASAVPSPNKASQTAGSDGCARSKLSRSRTRGIKAEEPPVKRIKVEVLEDDGSSPEVSAGVKSEAIEKQLSAVLDTLRAKKLKSYYGAADGAPASPFSDFPRPTQEECKLAHEILSEMHGERKRPVARITSGPANRAGCGDAPTVLDALVRTILSQNTSDVNSSRAKRSMDAAYDGHDNWEAVAQGGKERLEGVIRCGGLSVVKSKVIVDILEQCRERYGEYSLEHLRDLSNEDAMREMLGFKGVGPKTASCVLLFCLGRESFAVDTHVWRITGLLGWRPVGASRDETHLHLDARIPGEEKYGLHILLVEHGKVCKGCKAGAGEKGKCELTRRLRAEAGSAGEVVKKKEGEA